MSDLFLNQAPDTVKTDRRQLLKLLAATGGSLALSTTLPVKWAEPVVEVGMLPAHAQASPAEPIIITTLCPDESLTDSLTSTISAIPGKADVFFIFDTTGSMGGVLNQAKSEANAILTELSALIPDVNFGVANLRDYNIFAPGEAYAYQLDQPITGDQALVIEAINNLGLGGGGDGPEAYTRALFESYSDPSLGFRSDARRFIVMFGDNVPHDDDLNEGVPDPPINPGGVYCGVITCVLDPGRDGILDTADDLNLQTVLNDVAANQITLLYIQSAFDTNLLYYWNHWAGLTGSGGQAVLLNETGNLTDIIVDLIGTAGQKIDLLTLDTAPADFADWLKADSQTDLTIPVGGLTVSLNFTVTPPADTESGVYNFSIRTIGDGVVYAETEIQISVPTDC